MPFRSVARNAAALVDSPAKLCRSLWSVRGRIVDGPKAVDGRRVVHIDVEDIQEWIEGATVPFASAQVAWLREGALRAWRRVDGSGPILPEFLQRMLACGRRDVREVGFRERLAHQWGRLYRNRLRRPRLFARHRGSRHRDFVHRKQRLAGLSIQHERESHLRELNDGVPRCRARRERDENRRSRIVVVPDIVVDGLVVPLQCASGSIECKDAVGVEVRSLAEPSVEVIGRRAGCGEHPPSLFVYRDAAPRVGASVRLAVGPLPRLVARLALLRNRVKHPDEPSGEDVVGAYVAGRCVVALVHARPEDQQVPVDRAWRRHLEADGGRIHAKALAQIDVARFAERRDQAARLRVQRIDPVFDEVKDPFALLALPIRDAAIAQPDHGSALVVLRRIERPDLAPGRGVERNGLEARRGDVHPPVHHDRVHVHGRALGGVSRVVSHAGASRWTFAAWICASGTY